MPEAGAHRELDAAALKDAPGPELHWYEAHGIGRKEVKRKGYVD
jgi:hypothetical protein